MNRAQFAEAVLQGSGKPETEANLIAMLTWMQSEHAISDDSPQAYNNPFNSEYPEVGSGLFNDVGVRDYTTPEMGISATIHTLGNGFYPEINACLEAGNNASQTLAAVAESRWGSKPTGQMLSDVTANPTPYALAPIAGPPTESTGTTEPTTTTTTEGTVEPTIDGPIPSADDGEVISAPIAAAGTKPTSGGAESGYWLVGQDGAVYAFGTAQYFGGPNTVDGKPNKLKAPVVAIAPTPTGNGYIIVCADGAVFAYGDATFQGVA